MSAGFFGSYFRRRKGEDQPSSSGGRDERAGRSQSEPEASFGNRPRTGGANDYLRYGLRGAPKSEGEPAQSEPRYQVSPIVQKPAPVESEPVQEPVEPVPQHDEPAAHGQQPAEEASPLDGLMQDRVVMALLQEGVITMPQALTALRQQKRHPNVSIWRLLTGVAGVDADAVFAEAARVAGYETVHISERKPTDELVEAVCGLFPSPAGDEMLRMGVIPYEFNVDPAARKHTLVFASHDPSHPDVRHFVESLGPNVELRYAPASMIGERIRRIQQKRNPGNEGQAAEAGKKNVACRVARAPESHEEITYDQLFAEERGSRDFSSIFPNGLSLDDLARVMQTDTVAGEDVLVEERFDPATPGVFSGDGLADETPESGRSLSYGEEEPIPGPMRVDGSEGNPPSIQLTGWTGNPASDPSPASDYPGDDANRSAQQADLEIARKDRVVAMLLRKEIVTPEQVLEALQRQRREKSKEALWRVLAAGKDVERESIYAEAARVYAFPIAVLKEGQPDPEFARSVIETFPEERRNDLVKLRVLPFECDLEHQTGAIKLVFITHDPTRPEVHRLMQQLKLERFELRYASEAIVTAGLAEALPRKNEYLERMSEEGGAYDLGLAYDDSSSKLIDEEALDAEINRSTLINLFEATLVEAVRQGASDVHIFPNADKKIEIHFRTDGRLHLWHLEDKVHPEALLAVIKDNATNVDRFERDAAQDGFIQRWIDDALIRFRVSVLPIANASQELRSESIVIRVLDDRKVITDLRKLGLLDLALQRFDQAIRQPHGMVILTGPTGSGKSTTLVAALHQVVTPEVNVLTVEDPVEYIIPGVRQIKLNHKLGLEDALRSILRHDPDVVMVGEMRDRQTAELAIKLANTGHLTFSTLHTNDAPSAISRLYKMNIEPFLIAYAINLVVAQRLIRVLCPACKVVEDDPDPVMLKKLGFTDHEIETTTIYKPGHDESCKVCKGMGYKGRRAISEALYFSRAIRHLIVESDKMIDEEKIRDLAIKEGMLTLRDSAREVVKMGETSIMEMVRVVTTES